MYCIRLSEGNYVIYFTARNKKNAIRMSIDAMRRWTTYRVGHLFVCRQNRQDKLVAVIRRKADMRLEVVR